MSVNPLFTEIWFQLRPFLTFDEQSAEDFHVDHFWPINLELASFRSRISAQFQIGI